MEEKLFTKKDLAQRWGVTTTTIDRWMNDKVITPAKGIPSIRFTPQHVAELEGVKLDKLSPLERRRMLRETEELKNKLTDLEKENTELKEYVKSIVGHGVRFINIS